MLTNCHLEHSERSSRRQYIMRAISCRYRLRVEKERRNDLFHVSLFHFPMF